MEREFVPYNQALKLKELGFDEPCFDRFYTKPQSKMFGVDEKGRHYPIKNTSKKLYIMGEDFVLNDSNVISAPTYSQAFRWFREKYNLYHTIDKQGYWFFQIKKDEGFGDLTEVIVSYDYNSYEEAELACLEKLIEIVEPELN
jgi:hypothetical protein